MSLSFSQKDTKSCSVSKGQELKSIPVYLSRMLSSMIQVHRGFRLGTSPQASLLGLPTAGWLPTSWDMMVKHGSTCGVHSGRENVTLTTAHRPCLEVVQAWSLFFTSSSLPRHLDPSLAFHRHDMESVPAFTDSLLLGDQLLAERYKHALFSKTFPISGGRQSATAGTTAAFG